MDQDWHIRPARACDLDPMLTVESACYDHPWSRQLFQQEFDNPLASVELLWVGDELAGYLVSWYLVGELHILNVATAPAFRRRQVARRLLENAFDRCREEGLERALLEVRSGNVGAIALYRSLGFEPGAIRKRYYADGEDALLMAREFSDATAG